MGEFSEKQKTFMNNLFQQLNTTINETASKIRSEFKKELEIVRTEVSCINNNVEERVAKIEAENKELQNRIIKLERKQRRNNIIIYGIKSSDVNIKDSVIKVIKDILEIDIREEYIKEVYRLVNRKNSGSTTVLVSFSSYEYKIQVLKNTKKLNGKGIYISNDQCWEDRQQTKKLLLYQKKFRNNGDTAYIKEGKLIVANKIFTIEELENQDQEILGSGTEKNEERKELEVEQRRPFQDSREREQEQLKLKACQKEVSATELSSKKITTRSHAKN